MTNFVCTECYRIHHDRAADAPDWAVTTFEGTPLCVYCPRHLPKPYAFCTKHGLPQTATPRDPYDPCASCCIDRYIDATPNEQRAIVLDHIETRALQSYADWGLLDRFEVELADTFTHARSVLIDAEFEVNRS